MSQAQNYFKPWSNPSPNKFSLKPRPDPNKYSLYLYKGPHKQLLRRIVRVNGARDVLERFAMRL